MKPKTAKRLTAAAIIAAVFAVALILFWPWMPEYEITEIANAKWAGYVSAINNEGQVAGWVHAQRPTGPPAFIWSPGRGRRSIQALEGKVSAAYDINDKGQVVGYYLRPMGEKRLVRAFIWDEETGLTELGTLGDYSQAQAVNNKGQIVGVSRTSDGQSRHAFIWDKTNGMRDLGTLGGKSSSANDINEKGQIVATLIKSQPQQVLLLTPKAKSKPAKR